MTDLFFLVLARDSATHLQILARLGRILQREGVIDQLRQLESSQESYNLLVQADEQVNK
jgi:PTS system nitrogen regulatory IIA component